MGTPRIDYSKLTVDERLQLVEEIWDSVALDAPEQIPVTEAHARELDSRLAAYQGDGEPGRPWREALDDIDDELTGRRR